MEAHLSVKCFMYSILYTMTDVIACFTFKMVGTNMETDAQIRKMYLYEGKGHYIIIHS